MRFLFSENNATEHFNKHWQFCIGSDHASTLLRKDAVEQLKYVHDELNIKRVRFHGIFHDDMHTLHTLYDLYPLPGGWNYKEQSFRNCGLVYDNILEIGMKPFVELSFMPTKLAKHKFHKGLFYYKPCISLPKNDKVWTNYVRDFVHYLIRRYGKEEVETWFFEIWNEPDLYIPFFRGSQKDYFHLYEITCKTIKEIDPNIKVGGPSTAECRWISEFKDFCEKNNVPFDFISTHQYSGDPLGGVDSTDNGELKKDAPPIDFVAMAKSCLRPFKNAKKKTFLEGYRSFMPDKSETVDYPDNKFYKNATLVKNELGNIPTFYTEWNANAIFTAYTNDTRKVAAYDVKTAIDINQLATGSALFCYSDIFEELHPFPEEFHGGFGMLTQHGIPKPWFWAVKMLNQLSDERYSFDVDEYMHGEISIAATKNNEGIQVLLTRQKLKNLDLPAETAEVTIEMANAPTSVTVQKIDENHCNPLKIWEEMGSPLDMTKAEINTIKEQSKLVCENLDYKYENGKLTFIAPLFVNDVWLVKINKL